MKPHKMTFGVLCPGMILLSAAEGCSCECYCYSIMDCQSFQEMGHTTSGVYSVIPKGIKAGYNVYCDMTTDGGGWLIFQRRFDGSEDFYRGWTDYELGFGNASQEYWLGLDPLNKILEQGFYELRVDLYDWEGNTSYAKYGRFGITDYKDDYRLTAMLYSGTAGDSLQHHNGQKFSTNDFDNDDRSGNCAIRYHGAWWYKDCKWVNLNGKYYSETQNPLSFDDGVEWYNWRGDYYSLKMTEMKIRRI